MFIELAQPPLPPIFILSCARSGSTLLRYIIDTHPDICCPPELGLGALCQRLWHVYYSTTGQALNVGDEAEKRKLVLAEVKRNVSNIMMSYANIKNKKMWCEKSPDNLVFLNIIKDVFPDAMYICLHRNCLDVVHSLLEVSRYGFMDDVAGYVHRNPHNLVAAFAEYWSNYTETLLRLEREHTSQCFRVNYESLVSNPSEISEQLFAFLKVRWDESLLNNIFSAPHDSWHGDSKIWFAKGIYQTSVGKGSALTAAQVDSMLERVNRLLDQLAYPMIGSDSDGGLLAGMNASVKKDTGEDSLTITEMFINQVPRRLTERGGKLQGISAACKFVITGTANDMWMINFNGQECQVALAAQDGRADCTITVSASDLIEIETGKLNPGEAYLQGKVYINGDMYIARIIGEALFGA